MSNITNPKAAKNNQEFYLTCERYYIFELLTLAGGMMGLYTYNMRGGVFCNAQTGNVAMMSMAFGKGNFREAGYYLIPLIAYILGTIVSEVMPLKIRKSHFMRWDTLLVGIEATVLILIGFIPLTMPHQIVQVMINFLCSMQFNTFRQAEGIPMATTFITNHVRQIGVNIASVIRDHENSSAKQKLRKHSQLLITFFTGGAIMTFMSKFLQERAIWIAVLPLIISFVFLLHADLVNEKSKLDVTPHGH